MLTPKPKGGISLLQVLRKIEARQEAIDRTVRISDRQMDDVENELKKRTMRPDPGAIFRQAELEWYQRRRGDVDGY